MGLSHLGSSTCYSWNRCQWSPFIQFSPYNTAEPGMVKWLETLKHFLVFLSENHTLAVHSTEASISNDKKTAENQSLTDSIAAETDKDIEQDELDAENVKPSPSPGSNASVSVLKVDKVTEPSVTVSPSGHANSTQYSTQASNTTASPQVTLIDSTENNQS